MDQHRTQTLMALALAFGGGMCLPLQAIINGRLVGFLGTPHLASTAQNCVGAIAALLIGSFMWPTRVGLTQIAATPIWAWTGGLLGMIYVLAGVIAAPRIGPTLMMSGVICGQLISSLILDQIGVLQERRPIEASSIIGLGLLLAGAILMLRRA